MKNPLVVKVGGALLDDAKAAAKLFSVIQKILETQPVILVHGGGNRVESLLTALGLTSEKLDGLRVTPESQLPYIVGALAGTVNKTLSAWAIKSGLSTVGLSLLDGGLCQCQQINEKLGAVGTATPLSVDVLTPLLNTKKLPIISSIGADTQGNLLNINADEAAACIASLVQGQLVLLSDVPCVLDAQKRPIGTLNAAEIDSLVASSVIEGGMAVKVKAALDTANSIGLPVCIASWKTPEQLLLLARSEPCGTMILPNSTSNLSGDSTQQ
ncbi:acetylglutamate kinase [Alteromonas sp. a30]|uniref:acetylglutamate kinase n=1 Tax=Alteromonas sp. a30 TaxID=2730917 RepID=UPI00227DE020|nr:acetylglutamate kinase [Alteromonas sp. a30]MCY7295290.1 acetylglutamate kinase [Alteromonas sp. a30]